MLTEKKRNFLAKLALFVAALIWGSSFFIVKNTVDVFQPNILLGVRFTIACALLSIVFYKKWKLVNKSYLWRGAVMGVLLFIAYCLQTIGLTDTTPGKNAFLTAVYCVIVPFLFWAVNRIRPDRYNVLAAVICIAGIGLVSLSGDFTIRFGDALTLASGIFYALHIVAVARFAKGHDMILLTILQFGMVAVLSWGAGLLFEELPTQCDPATLLGLIYLAVCATGIALLLQNLGQKYTHPSAAAIILSLESVFGVMFSMLFYGERLTARLGVGFLFIFVAVLISETKLAFLIKEKAEKIS